VADFEVRESYERPFLERLNIENARQIVLNHAREFLQFVLPSRRPELAAEQTHKSYEKPALRKLTPEQAKLLLVGHASLGNPGAHDLMELIFPEQNQSPFSQ
jgi:hypothetical protein